MNICLFGDAGSIHLRRLAMGLARLDATVHVVSHKPADIPGVTVERFRIPGPSLMNPRRWTARYVRYVRGLVEAFDVVNVQFLADWGLTEAMFECGTIVATAWGSDIVPPPGEGTPPPELTAARRMLLHRASAVTTCGPSFADVVADYAGLDRSRIDVLPFGVDLNLFDPDRFAAHEGRTDARSDRSTRRSLPRSCKTLTASQSPSDQPTVGFFKGFRAVYGPEVLMHAIPIVLEHMPDVRFELVGDGTQRDLCQCMARTQGVEHAVRFLPRRNHDAIPAVLARWDVSVIPSIHEAFGVAALESSAMRVPVVASDVCGLRDTVRDGQTGRLVPCGDAEALADALVQLLSDAQTRLRMGETGRCFVAEHFEADDVHRRWLRFFEQVRERRCMMV